MENVSLGIIKALAPLALIDRKNVDTWEEHIKEEIADVMVMLKQFQLYYNIPTEEIKKVMKNKIDRQIKRIEEGKS